MIDKYKVDKIAGFFNFGWRDGYKTSDLWWLMRNSTSGRGMLNNNPLYTEHHQGSRSLSLAFEEINPTFEKENPPFGDHVDLSNLFGYFIEFAHGSFNLDYNHMFDKYPIDDFIKDFGFALGNYDDKIIKKYLL